MQNKEMRAVYAETLIELAEKNQGIVILEADLMRANGTGIFKNKFPERAFNIGVAEANMVGVAAGMSARGKIPFATTFGCFASRRAYDQFFLSANYAKLNVKLVGSDPGVSAAFNGGTHMPFEDVGLMRIIPGLIVFEPADPYSLKQLLIQSAEHKGSTYMRLHRKAVPAIYTENDKFTLGKGIVIEDGKDLTLIGSGAVMMQEVLKAADMLKKDGISTAVIDMHTIKPIDAELIVKYASQTGLIVTCENHQIYNGLGSAVAEVVADKCPVTVKRIGVNDLFGEVGTQDYLKERFGLTALNIYTTAKNSLSSKK
ncbi:MAG: transketolase family protein [Spirochaetes bacterium]|nr:transketolase family protein [Spirochaetota bacterium]